MTSSSNHICLVWSRARYTMVTRSN
uniref:Uncharacterized protein n=1 Tax=Arundo donax TaxID=35708 RepID=A0A0A9AQ09_ARUDO